MQPLTRRFLDSHSSMLLHATICKREPRKVVNPAELDRDYFFSLIYQYTQLSQEKIISKSRKRNLTDTRFYCYLVFREMNWKLKAIAKLFNRDHSTVMAGLARISGIIENNEQTKKEFQAFKNILTPALYA